MYDKEFSTALDRFQSLLGRLMIRLVDWLAAKLPDSR